MYVYLTTEINERYIYNSFLSRETALKLEEGLAENGEIKLLQTTTERIERNLALANSVYFAAYRDDPYNGK